MRTTLDISDPVLEDVRKLQEEEGGTLGELVSELLAAGLATRRRDTARAPLVWIARDLGARVDLRDKEAVWALLDRESMLGR